MAKIKMHFNVVCSFAADSCGLGWGPMVGRCEHGNESSVLIGRRFLEQLGYN